VRFGRAAVRRIVHFLVVALVGAAVLPAVAQAGPNVRSPGDSLDLLITLDRPATASMTRRLTDLGTNTWTAKHIPRLLW
jgi:hypothetical protein